jgi:hypothetical protein
VNKYVEACARYGLDPGTVRLFAVGSIARDDGADFRDTSDIDLVFSVEHPDQSLSAAPRQVQSRSEGEAELEARQGELLGQLDEVWQAHGISQPLNIPYGESVPYPWGLSLMEETDFTSAKPGILLFEHKPQ